MSALAGRLPDLPRLVETRGMLLSGDCELIGDVPAGHCVVRSAAAGVAAVVGQPDADALRQAVADGSIVDVLCPEDAASCATEALPAWRPQPALIHTLGPGCAAAGRSPRAELRLVKTEDALPLHHVPLALRREYERARRQSAFAVALAEGLPVSFAYVPWETETLCDVSIDTLPGYRRRGLAAATVQLLVDHIAARGKQPVWGALTDNAGSLALARRLGFTPVDRLIVLSRRRREE